MLVVTNAPPFHHQGRTNNLLLSDTNRSAIGKLAISPGRFILLRLVDFAPRLSLAGFFLVAVDELSRTILVIVCFFILVGIGIVEELELLGIDEIVDICGMDWSVSSKREDKGS